MKKKGEGLLVHMQHVEWKCVCVVSADPLRVQTKSMQ